MPDAFLFDIGKVILPFDFAIAIEKILSHSRIETEEELIRIITPLNAAMEVGQLSSADFMARLSPEIGYEGDSASFRRIYSDIFDPNLEMISFIENLHAQGVPLYLLSNTNEIHASFFEAEYPVFSLFDGHIYSHEEGLAKPDPAIFSLAVERFSLEPKRTVYTDDLLENCEAAAQVGFYAIPYAKERHGEFLAKVANFSEGRL